MLIAVCEDQKNDRQLLLEYLNTELELSLIHISSSRQKGIPVDCQNPSFHAWRKPDFSAAASRYLFH